METDDLGASSAGGFPNLRKDRTFPFSGEF